MLYYTMNENYENKKKSLKQSLKGIKNKKNKHYNKFRKFKRWNMIIKAIINGLNAISVSSIVVSMSPVSPVMIIIALTSTSLSGVITATTNAIGIDDKVNGHQTSYQQYGDLYRDINARLLRNGLSSEDLDNLLSDLNTRLSLIEDNSLPISNEISN